MTPLWLVSLVWLAGGTFERQIPLANNHANELFEQKDYQGALDAYLEALNEDRGNGALAYNIANTYSALGDEENAAKYYEKAMQSQNQDASQLAQFNMGNLEMARKQPDKAMNHYIDYLKRRPNDIDAKRNLELALRQMQQQNQQQQQDQENKDQKDQQQQQQENQQGQGQENQEDQEQQSQNDQQQNQDQQEQQNQNQNQQQDQEQQGQDQQNQQQNQQQQQDSEQQQSQAQRDQQEQPQDQQAPKPQEQDKAMDEQLKQQILDALNEQELQQQKAFQQRQIGKVKRRSKDW